MTPDVSRQSSFGVCRAIFNPSPFRISSPALCPHRSWLVEQGTGEVGLVASPRLLRDGSERLELVDQEGEGSGRGRH